MHLPVTTAIAASGMLLAARYDTSSYKTSDALSISVPAVVMRQNAPASGPHTTMTSTILTTSVVSITSHSTSSTMVSISDTKTVTSSPLPPVPTTTATSHLGMSSAPMTTTTSHPETSSASKSTAATSVPLTSTPATSTAIETISTTSTAATSTVATSAAAASATQSTEPISGSTPWATKGKIAGIVVGSVLGLVFLGLLVYALFAASRGINVCNCCGGCFGKRDDDEDTGRLPSRSSDTYPFPEGSNPGPGTGYYRPARPLMQGPLPLALLQQVDDERREGKLQRKRG
ncbi:hypothetical protein PTTW11_04251 [Pyrenophora teres f. teres]|uniref:Uncharacterized protein n=1 Tax=Pyrenophora teres f. teres TaxID=97479 RepID=A0A6S6VYP7_9PLEO|nr:hypothetical protein PTTW11_04251 [Pyrenophora teres f. teres]